ncbi:MAG: hypothetical protein ACI4UK_02140, partial [Floccifex sp.]
GISQGLSQGISQGISQGKAEGIAIGEAKGKLEEKEKMAHKLQGIGMSEEKIAAIVECNISQVKEWLS